MATINFLQNVYIKVSGSIKVPVIQADISDYSGMTKADIDDIYTQIAANMKGSLCACSLQISPQDQALFGDIPVGTTTYGDSSGFQVSFRRFPSPYSNFIGEVTLLYKGTPLGTVGRSGVAQSYMIGYYVLFTSDGKILWRTGPYSVNGFVMGYSSTPGLTNYDNKFINAILEDGILGLVSTPALYTELGDDISEDVLPIKSNDDPYEPGEESETGGGTGNFDGSSDNIDIPNLPTLSAVDTGFITLFNPSVSELKNLANYMWSGLFDLDTWKKIFADPMDAILGLSIVPVAVPNGGSSPVTVGNISTGVSMNKAATQYVAVDCGTLNVNEYWGAYLDYDPYTKAEIYLPYIGAHPLAVDDIMNKPVHVVYHVDVLSGACCAYVKCGGSVLYTFAGQCSCSIPITGNDWTNVINGALSIAGSIGSMVATGGATAPMAIASIASTAVNSMKPNVEKSGSLGGTSGLLGIQTPYMILTRPRQALPKNQNKFIGYPSFITRTLSDVTGYTEIESVHLDGIPATEQELSEIESLLKGGVIL